MGTTKKPAPRRKRPATGKGKPAVKVQAPRPRKKKPAVQNIVLPPVAPGHYQQVEVPPAIISRIEPIPAEPRVMSGFLPNGFIMESDKPITAEEIERRSNEVRASARQPVIGEHLDMTNGIDASNLNDAIYRNARAGDIALTVLFILLVVFVLALIARSAV